jgi:hypothetical protein
LLAEKETDDPTYATALFQWIARFPSFAANVMPKVRGGVGFHSEKSGYAVTPASVTILLARFRPQSDTV